MYEDYDMRKAAADCTISGCRNFNFGHTIMYACSCVHVYEVHVIGT